jgi:diacylglycerol kinase (ATP)
MTSLKHLVIYNPTAGKGAAASRIPETEALLEAAGIDYDLKVTQRVWHAAELARDAGKSGYAVAVAAGGDGTVNEVVNGLMLAQAEGQDIPILGVLSIGRGNDFSYGADVPGDLAGCVGALAEGQLRPMDVGRVSGGDYPGGRFFANGIGVGFDTIVGLEAAKLKRVHGFMAYVIGALRTFIMYPRAPEVRFEHDSGVIEKATHEVSIMNGKRMGGTFFMAPRSVNHDGLFDYFIADRLTRRDMIDLMLRLTKGTQEGHPKLETGRSSRIAIAAPGGGLVVHADGETICTDGRSLLVECLPSRIRIVCQAGNPRR